MTWGGPLGTGGTITHSAGVVVKEFVYEDGRVFWRCACGKSFDVKQWAIDHLAVDHKGGAGGPAPADDSPLQLNELRLELEAAIEKARLEGLAEGYYQGLDVASQAADKIHEAAGRWGNAEETAVGMVCNELDELKALARTGRPERV